MTRPVSRIPSARVTRALWPLPSSFHHWRRSPDLDKQVVILDDPLSSLDETRREATAWVLLELSPKLKQLCVLTHKKDFLWMVFDKIPDNKAGVKSPISSCSFKIRKREAPLKYSVSKILKVKGSGRKRR